MAVADVVYYWLIKQYDLTQPWQPCYTILRTYASLMQAVSLQDQFNPGTLEQVLIIADIFIAEVIHLECRLIQDNAAVKLIEQFMNIFRITFNVMHVNLDRIREASSGALVQQNGLPGQK